ncbi:hypothetical protein CROQUDRAFT_52566 [Cronartium quercuum f. sp. fusiforme G11]|uniref:Uncharacterized protein n=1 Tax=Cronartium quercuum f. sp. fusiforme G11 TaxID=708437 RepID=A0A9P6N6W0_9BASI|nr:hypothetical protein CROQUDRAFT_52566 [Cronartium quercuum f. sp. fusiforme G11]
MIHLAQYMAHANDGDQRNESQKDLDAQKPGRFEAGQLHSHLANDSKDGRSIANRLESELSKNHDPEHNPDPNIPDKGQAPTELAKQHGNKPSKGAVIDEQIKLEEEAEVSLLPNLCLRKSTFSLF